MLLQGSKVTVTLRGGARYEGILSTASTEGEFGVALKRARNLDDVDLSTPKKSILIMPKDLVELQASDVDLEQLRRSGAAQEQRETFKTDTDISGQGGGPRQNRELQQWVASGNNDTLEGLEDTRGKPWDQFAANEQLFGATTNYDEEIYTTRLDRNAADYRQREKRAAQLEREILSVSLPYLGPKSPELGVAMRSYTTCLGREGDIDERPYLGGERIGG